MKNKITALILIGFAMAGASVYAQEAASTAVNASGKESVFQLLLKGGVVMIPLGLASLVAVTLFFERLIMLKKNNVIDEDFIKDLKELTGASSPKLDKAYELCVNNSSPIARILKTGVERWRKKRSLDYIEKGLEESAVREVDLMERSLRGFKIVAGIAPLLGLLGTVYGMIRAFQTVALSSEAIGKAAKLATGIYEAMVTTAAGLTIAIPTLLVYYYFARKVDLFTDEIEKHCSELVDNYLDSQSEER